MKKLLFTIASALIITSCGGGGGGSASTAPSYTGLTTPVAVDATNVEPIALKTVEATTQAITQNTAQESNPLAVSITATQDNKINQIVFDIARTVASNSANLPTALTISYTDLGFPFCGGSITISDSIVNSFDQFGNQISNMNGSMTLNSLCYNDFTLGDILMSGTVTIAETDTTITMTYANFSMTLEGEKHTINMTVSCNTSINFDCTITSNYEGTDGKVYRIADVSISGFDTGPYFFSATFSHPDFGTVDVTTTIGIYFNCPAGNPSPSAGTIQFTGSNGSSGTITFNGDCSSYDGTWDNSTLAPPAPTSGIYSGSWL